MTYCIGWIYKDSVYLVADTAATKSDTPTTSFSTFGEHHGETKHGYVEESLIKIIPIATDCIASYSGDVSLAMRVIKFVIENYSSQDKLHLVLNSLNSSLGPFKESAALLFASYGEKGPSLLRWESGLEKCVNVDRFYQYGSLVTYHAHLTVEVLNYLYDKNIPENNYLPIATGVIQSYGIHDSMIDQNIGGLVFGARVSKNGVQWQDDTKYVLYTPTFTTLDFVSAFVRDDVIVTNSSMSKMTKYMMSGLSNKSVETWLSTWESNIPKILRSKGFQHWVFLSKKEKSITIVNWPESKSDCEHLILKHVDSDHFELGMSPKLMSVLKTPLSDRGDGSIPFRLVFLNC